MEYDSALKEKEILSHDLALREKEILSHVLQHG